MANKAGFESLAKSLTERQHELQRLCKKAIDTGEPVWMGVWGPTGHDLYISAKSKAPPSREHHDK